jgi:hypothetical protein
MFQCFEVLMLLFGGRNLCIAADKEGFLYLTLVRCYVHHARDIDISFTTKEDRGHCQTGFTNYDIRLRLNEEESTWAGVKKRLRYGKSSVFKSYSSLAP